MRRPLLVIAFSGIALLASFGGCDARQSPPPCLVAHGGFALNYQPLPGQNLTGACQAKLAEVAGVQPYWGQGGRAQESVALKTATLTALEEAPNQGLDPDHPVWSQGSLSAQEPDGEGMCHVPTLSAAEQHLPAQPEDPDAGMDAIPAKDISYRFSNLQFFVAPDAPGTQLKAELEYEEDGCLGRYQVLGVYPAVSCAVLDEHGDPVLTPEGKQAVDESLCTHANDYGRALNPNFPVVCEPKSALCVLEGSSFPQLRSGE